MQKLLSEIRDCTLCEKQLPLGSRPIISATPSSKILLVSQAPGRVVHKSGVAWNDQSGEKLRQWLGVDEATFYNPSNFAILPMGFCYPGKGKTGDLPPRPECAPTWHQKVLDTFQQTPLTLLIGAYAAAYYLPNEKMNLTEKVRAYEKFLPSYWPLPHPSPVNRFWRSRNPWFEEMVVPLLQQKIQQVLK